MRILRDDVSFQSRKRPRTDLHSPQLLVIPPIRRLSQDEPPFDAHVFLTRSCALDGMRSLPNGLVGRVPPKAYWDPSDLKAWKTQKLCLVSFVGRHTFKVPAAALALR